MTKPARARANDSAPIVKQPMRTVIAIADDYRRIITESDGEIVPAFEDVEGERDAKVTAYQAVYAEMQANAGALEELSKDLAERKKRVLDAAERMRARLEIAFTIGEWDKIKTPLGTAFFKTSSHVELDEGFTENADPRHVRVSFTADKTAIRESIEDGEDVPGARIVETRKLVMGTHRSPTTRRKLQQPQPAALPEEGEP